ncbi:MAG: hypothetical protein CM15mP84_06190 [Cellvibrionales bacterium]|nr:MAG: hypothetical protein CM15mP84_06190 [Cellvibrionales bacterium]
MPRARCAPASFYPISTHLKQEETAYIITNCKAKLFVASAALSEVAIEAAAASGGLSRCLSVGGHIDGFEPLDEQLAALPVTPSRMSFWGRQCCIRRDHWQAQGVYWEPHAESIHTEHPMSGQCGCFFGFGVDTVYLSPAPLYHAAPLHYNIMVLGLGGTSLIWSTSTPSNPRADRALQGHSQPVGPDHVRENAETPEAPVPNMT